MEKVIFIEISGDATRDIKKSLLIGDFFEWTNEQIRYAFNWHNGTLAHFKRYARDNKANTKIISYEKALKICPNSPFLREYNPCVNYSHLPPKVV